MLVDAASLQERHIAADDLSIPVKILKAKEVRQLTINSDVVINL